MNVELKKLEPNDHPVLTLKAQTIDEGFQLGELWGIHAEAFSIGWGSDSTLHFDLRPQEPKLDIPGFDRLSPSGTKDWSLEELATALLPLAKFACWVDDVVEDGVYLGTQLGGHDNDTTPTVGECRHARKLLLKLGVTGLEMMNE